MHQKRLIAIALTSWTLYAYIARSKPLTVWKSDYIAAVKLMGVSPMRIVLRQVMPLCISSLIVRVTLDITVIIFTTAGLGFNLLGDGLRDALDTQSDGQ